MTIEQQKQEEEERRSLEESLKVARYADAMIKRSRDAWETRCTQYGDTGACGRAMYVNPEDKK